MAKWIDAEAELESLKGAVFFSDMETTCGVATYKRFLKNGVERSTGHWIYSTSNESVCEEWTCDKCGAEVFVKTPYCPICGAKMEDNDETD